MQYFLIGVHFGRAMPKFCSGVLPTSTWVPGAACFFCVAGQEFCIKCDEWFRGRPRVPAGFYAPLATLSGRGLCFGERVPMPQVNRTVAFASDVNSSELV